MHVAIIGAGFTGSALAVELLDRLGAGDTVSLIEKTERFGPGLAYSTQHPDHLVNVSADRLSMRADEPDHLVRWLAARTGASGAPLGASSYIPRKLYGEYLSESLNEAALRSSAGLDLVQDEVVGIERAGGGFVVGLKSGHAIDADEVAICTGHVAAPPPAGVRDRADSVTGRIVADPWAAGWVRRVGRKDNILMLGCGLTMVDQVLSLARAGHAGTVTAVSRRGVLPTAHLPVREPPRDIPDFDPAAPLGRTVRVVRREIRRAMAAGGDWRPTIDALRPHLQQIWKSLSDVERRRFLRHMRPYWETHRHRMAPQVAETIGRLIADGRLRVVAGKVEEIAPAGEEVEARWRRRGERVSRTHTYDWVVNCTGLECSLESAAAPLLRDLVAAGDLRPGPCGLGADIEESGIVVDGSGEPVDGLYALGPLGRGVLWEITAIGEIRRQCADVAGAIAARRDAPTVLLSDIMAMRAF